MKFYRDVSNVTLERQFIGSMFLQPRSLLLLKGDMYKKYLHGIDDTFMDILKPGTIFNFDLCPDIEADQKLVRGKRVALTFRNVPRISRILVDTLVVPPLTPRSRKKRIAQEFGRTSTPSSDSSVGSNK
uniref:Uncharacterized protein n=1 Tax=Romanomermis culicivorax TaxID=13658 RepID=A0A915KE31_ROMCU